VLLWLGLLKLPGLFLAPQVKVSWDLPLWLLQDAKARSSELVRRVRSEGPQHVTVHGRDEVVVIAAEEFRRLMATSPEKRWILGRRHIRGPVWHRGKQ
jgi:prevent-host-death family protein